MQQNYYAKIIVGLTFLLLITAVISLGIGRYSLSIPQIGQVLWSKLTALEIEPVHQQIIFQVRLPRILTVLCVGAGLALSGVVLQGIFRNPLVDPHIIGVTSSSAFGGTLAIFLGFSLYGLFTSTILLGVLTLALVFLFSFKFNQRSLLMLILIGMILSGLFSALVSLLQYISDTEEKLPSIVFWLMGSFATANWEKFGFFVIPFSICSLILFKLSWRLNLLSLDDKEVKALGMNVVPLRWLVIFLSGTLVACQVAISGSIGWVGLIIPHISRMLVGANHQRLLPCTMLIGAVYLLMVDNVARSLSDAEIPISILTALLGAPLFSLLVYQLKRGRINE
ncbi:FecCD family ABC transporter permease [Rodentibacter myodis]|nr:iron ABC transporter permease [Rodentibacter myodis]